MIIEGSNLGRKEVIFKPLSNWDYFYDERQELIKQIEQLYRTALEESLSCEIKPFPQNDGKVELIEGMINHRCSNNIAVLSSISQYGILASEWFGIMESEKEGRFCCFTERINSGNFISRLRSPGNDMLLFFDQDNPIIKKLLHLDFFEYERIKIKSPEKLQDIYKPEEIEIFDKIIEPLSPGAKHIYFSNIYSLYGWSAILSGIPPMLVNGICIKNNSYNSDYIDALVKLFPNATIFTGDLKIIYSPTLNKSNHTL